MPAPEFPGDPINAFPPPFDYAQLPDSMREAVLAATEDIHGANANLARNIVQIGLRLLRVRNRIGSKRFASWRKANFKDLDEATTSRFMQVARVFGGLEDLSHFMPEALYLLASPDVSPAARTEAICRAQCGERITQIKAEAIVAGRK